MLGRGCASDSCRSGRKWKHCHLGCDKQPRDIFRPVISHSAYSFVLAHNHPSGAMPYPVLHRMEYGSASSKAFFDAA